MSLNYFQIKSGDEDLSIFSTTKSLDNISFILLHGAGKSDKKRLEKIAEWFSLKGIESIGFDFSGHGDSSSNTPNSIQKRINETLDIISYINNNKALTICAFSMSGQVSINILKELNHRIENLILCAPAIYHHEAITLPFGEEFSHLIRSHESWKNNNLQDILPQFKGKILVLIGENDTVIPNEIPKIILEHGAAACLKKYEIIDNAPHMLAGWTMESDENLENLCNRIYQFTRL